MRRTLCLAALFLSVLLARPASADLIEFSHIFEFEEVELTPFDRTLGTLNSVHVTIEGAVHGNARPDDLTGTFLGLLGFYATGFDDDFFVISSGSARAIPAFAGSESSFRGRFRFPGTTTDSSRAFAPTGWTTQAIRRSPSSSPAASAEARA